MRFYFFFYLSLSKARTMKRKLKVVLMATFALVLSFSSQSQSYVSMMGNPNSNFYQIQDSFNAYWNGRTIERGKGYKAFRRWEAYMEPRVYPTGNLTIPSQTYENYVEWSKTKSKSKGGTSLVKSVAGNWVLLGPVGKPGGGGAGRINFIRFDPVTSTTMFVGAPDGGLWKTTNGGTSWTTNTDQLAVIGCSDIAINPANNQIMYLATGDGDGGDTYSTGVLKSTDGGATWVATGLAWTANQGRTISRLLINSTNPLIVMAFGSTGIWRTTDGGTTWAQPTGTFTGIKDAEFKPGDVNTIYAAGTTFRKSTDGGATWGAAITTGLTGIGRLSIAVTAANPAYVYVLGSRATDDGFLGLIRSTDSGTSFTTRMASTATNNILGWDNGSDAGGQGWYDLTIAASPTNAEEVYTGGVNIWKSTNGGTSFTLNTHWFGGYSKPNVHADIHDIVFLPGSGTTVYSGNDGGVYRTTNSGTAWSDISANLAIAQQYRVGLSSSNVSLLVTGHQDNGTNKMNGTTWTEIYGGDGMDCFIDRTNNNNIYGSYVYGEYYRSTDGGTNWTAINTGLPAGDWLCAWHQDPVTATTLYAGGRAALYKTTNSGTGWTAMGTPTGSGNIIEFEIAPSNNQIIYALKTGTNAVSKSINGGTSFTSVSTGLPTTVAPTDIAISNTDPNIVFVTYSGYGSTSKVFKSINGGTSWTNLSTGLPNIPMNTIVYSNGSVDNGIYVGTDVGVYYKDNITNWVAFNVGLPNVAVRDLEIYYPTNRLRAATFGRGTWDSDLYTAVAAVPVASFTPSSTTICVGQSVTYTNTSSGIPTSYSWTFAGGTPSTSTATNPTITYNTVGTFQVDLTATNASGSNTLSQPNYITVIGGSGSALPLSEGFTLATFPPTNWPLINLDAGATTWARNATIGLAPTAGNSMWFDNFAFNDSGNSDELRTPRLNFQSLSSAQMTFDVAYAPYDATYFDGLEVLISTDCAQTFTSVYLKSSTVLATAAAQTTAFVPTSAQWRSETINLTPYIGQQNVVIAIRNLAGYGNNLYVDNINITGVAVAAAPVASFTSSPGSPVCTGQVVTYTSTSTNSPTSYSWTFAGGTPATSTAATQTVTYAAAGTYNVSLTATNASGSNTLNSPSYMTVISTPAVPGAITGSATVCSGTTGNVYSIAAVSGATSYTWTVPSGATITSGQGTVSATVTMGSTSGNITVTATNACGTSIASTLAITINTVPATPGVIAGSASVCSGSTGNIYTIAAVSGATGYTWTVPAGATITAGQGTVSATVTMGSTSGNVTVTASNTCGTSTASIRAITVTLVPATPGAIVGSASVCSGSTGNVYSITAVSGATSYTWTVPAGATITSGQGTISATVTMGSTSGNVTVTASNACGTSIASIRAITVIFTPVTPGIISGTTSLCSGSTGNVYSIAAVPGATSYTWTVPSGATITSGQGTVSATVTMGSTSGNITVTATNACGTSTASTLAITLNTVPAIPGAIAGSASLCSGSTGNIYSIAAVSGATNYTWTVPTGAIITSGQGTVSATVTMGSTSGNVTVTATNSCGASTASSLAITINSTPLVPGVIAGSVIACSNSTGNVYSIAAVSGATSYTWTVPAGATITAGQGTVSATVTMGAISGNVTVTASNSCGTSTASTLIVTLNTAAPATPGIISGTNTPCISSTGNVYTIAAVAGATNYAWTVPSGATITAGQGTVSITVTMGATPGNIAVTASSTCGTSAASSLAVTFNTTPAAPGIISGTTSLCSGSTGNVYTIAAVAGATSYLWTVPSGATITSGQGTVSATVTMGSTSGSVSVTASNACGTSAASSLVVSIVSTPTTPGVISGTATVCSGSTGNIYSIAAVSGATSYTWAAPSGSIITAGQGTVSATLTMGSTSGAVTVTSSNSCGASTASSLFLTSNSIPSAPGAITGSNSLCAGTTGNVYSIASVSGATSYLWTVPSGSTITSGQGSVSATVTMGSAPGNFTVSASNTCGSSSSSSLGVTVNNTPAIPTIIVDDNCGYTVLTTSSTESLLWSTGETVSSITVLLGGSYTLSAANGLCISGLSTAIANPISIPSIPVVSVVDNCGLSELTTTATGALSWSTNETSPTITVTTSGTYYVSQTVNGCISPVGSADANPLLIPIVSFDPIQDVCINASIFDLVGGIPAGGNYNGFGVTSNQFDPSVSGYGTFMIDYTYSDVNGCSSSSQQTVTVGCAEITETELNSISIFPNPSNGLFSVLAEGLKVESIRIYDATGKLVKLVLNSNNSKELKIDLSDCSEGIYTIEVTSNVSITRDRVIVAN